MTRTRVVLATVLALAVGVAAAVIWWTSSATTDPPASGDGPTATPTPVPTPLSSPSVRSAARSACGTGAPAPYVPTSIKVAGLERAWPVIAPPRDARGIPGVPPLTTAGKQVFAFDPEQGIRPGDPRGNVLLNAHTWPDGSALGNELLETLERGDRIVVKGKGARLCYRVTERVEVSAAAGLARYYATDGAPQLAIVVCSGRRLGPGAWENRTIWFASPTA